MDDLPPIPESPVPDQARLRACSAGTGDGQVELFGPPEPMLALGRWLRSTISASVDLAGTDRAGWVQHPGSLQVEVDPQRSELTVSVHDGCVVICGDAGSLDRLGELAQDVGVKALDWRWAPTEQRRSVAPLAGEDPPVHENSLVLHLVSAYPL